MRREGEFPLSGFPVWEERIQPSGGVKRRSMAGGAAKMRGVAALCAFVIVFLVRLPSRNRCAVSTSPPGGGWERVDRPRTYQHLPEQVASQAIRRAEQRAPNLPLEGRSKFGTRQRDELREGGSPPTMSLSPSPVNQTLHIFVGAAGDVVGVDIPAVEADLHGEIAVEAGLLERCRSKSTKSPVPSPGGRRLLSARWTWREVLAEAVDVVGGDLVAVDGVVGVEHQLDVRRVRPRASCAMRVVGAVDEIAVGRGRLDARW